MAVDDIPETVRFGMIGRSFVHEHRRARLLLLLDEALRRDAQLELHEVLEGVVVELAVLHHALHGARVAEADDLGVADLVLDLVVADDVAEALGLGGQELALDELVHHRLLETLLLGHLRRVLRAAQHEEAVTKVVLRHELPRDLGRVVIVRHRVLAADTARLRTEADDEDRDQESEDGVDDHRLRRFPHLLEHCEGPPK